MNYIPASNEFEMLCVIVNFGLGSRVIKIAKQNGISGGTITLGRGTVGSRLLEFLEITDIRKEIVIIIAEKGHIYNLIDVLCKEMSLDKPHHGIAFTISAAGLFGARNAIDAENAERGAKNTMYSAVFVIVDKGKAESVVDAAKAAGAKGATIINARGSGIHETGMLFHMAIEPEKEIVLILTENNILDQVVGSIREHHNIDEPGQGIMFILDINKTYGLVK